MKAQGSWEDSEKGFEKTYWGEVRAPGRKLVMGSMIHRAYWPRIEATEDQHQDISSLPGVDLTAFVDAVADRVATKVLAHMRPTLPAGEETLLLTSRLPASWGEL
jgi:hypothetical protein